MNFANDSMHTSLCLQVEPQQVATACVYLASQFEQVQPANGADPLDIVGPMDVELLASISFQIIELIAERKGAEQAMLVKIRTNIEALHDTKTATNRNESLTQGEAKRPRLV
jgi:hypothetical protein